MKTCPHCGAGWLMHGTLQPAGVAVILCEESDCMWFDPQDVNRCGSSTPWMLADALGPEVVAEVTYDRYLEADDAPPGASWPAGPLPGGPSERCPVCRRGVLQPVYLAPWMRSGWQCTSCPAFWFEGGAVHWCVYLRLDRLLAAFGLDGSAVQPMPSPN